MVMMCRNIIVIIVALLAASGAEAAGDAAAGEKKAAICAACHGNKGISVIPLNPNLAGQVPGYVAAQLQAYKSGARANPIMAAQAALLSPVDMADLDAYYAALPAQVTSQLSAAEQELARAGQAIYRGGFAARGISACMSCHGPSGHGIPKNYPRVSAQHKEYLEQRLLAYKRGEYRGYNGIMADIAFGLSELQIKQLSAYMSGLQ